ncbi:MAG: Spy/CpxP family protein refolding chaperone [Phycisphaerae bacterium]
MRTRLSGVVILGMGLLVGSALAQAPGQGRQRGERPRRAGAAAPEGPQGPRRMTVDQQMERLTKELQLNADQQDKIRKLLTEHSEKMREAFRSRGQEQGQENRAQMRDLMTQLREARAAKDEAKVKELEAKLQEMRAKSPMGEARQKLMSDIEAVLTPEQKAKFPKVRDEVFGPWGGPPSLENNPEMLMRAVHDPSLNLSKDKEQAIRDLFKDWKTKSKGLQSAEEKKTAAADFYKKVMDQLTPEQQAKVKAWRPGPPPAGEGEGQPGNERGHRGRRGAHGAGAGGTPAAPQQ